MSKVKLKWKTGDVPMGRYWAFKQRPWPTANYGGSDIIAAFITSDDDRGYTPKLARRTEGLSLRILIADHSVTPFKWAALKTRAVSLKEAKTRALEFITRHPEYQPKPENIS